MRDRAVNYPVPSSKNERSVNHDPQSILYGGPSYECCHKWWKLMTRYLVTDSPDSAKAKEEPMDEVFHLN